MITSIAGLKTVYTTITAGDSNKTICKRDTVTVHALGEVLGADGAVVKKFWSTKDEGQQPFEYQVKD